MRCAICDFFVDETYSGDNFVKRDNHGDEVCRECREAILDCREYNGPLGESANIELMLAELERRLPGLFVGPVCPKADFECDCTYTTGCKKLLTDLPQVLV
jgi:hypothetical protein